MQTRQVSPQFIISISVHRREADVTRPRGLFQPDCDLPMQASFDGALHGAPDIAVNAKHNIESEHMEVYW